MTIKELEKQRLKEWFYKKHTWDIYTKLNNDFWEKKKELSWWKRSKSKEEEKEIMDKLLEELDRMWEESIAEDKKEESA